MSKNWPFIADNKKTLKRALDWWNGLIPQAQETMLNKHKISCIFSVATGRYLLDPEQAILLYSKYNRNECIYES